jgi:hypothetical protein
MISNLGDKLLCVKYEEFVKNPQKNLQEILHFLGLEYEPFVADGNGNQSGFPDWELPWKRFALEKISIQRIETWRNTLSSQEIDNIEYLGANELASLAYPLLSNVPKNVSIFNIVFLFKTIFNALLWLLTKRSYYNGEILNR